MRGLLVAIGLFALSIAPAQAQTPDKPVRLVLQITVDQLRGDMIERYSAMGPGKLSGSRRFCLRLRDQDGRRSEQGLRS